MQNTTKAMMRKFRMRVEEAAQHQGTSAGQLDGTGRPGPRCPPAKMPRMGLRMSFTRESVMPLEGAADDDAHRQVHHIAPGDEFAEFGQKAGGFFAQIGHGSSPVSNRRIRCA